MGWRFAALEKDGQWIVQDNEYRSTADKPALRTVCRCTERQEAQAIAAFMNGDLEGGRRLHQGFLSLLASCAKS